MLFRTVYGPELEAIYVFVAQQCGQEHSPSRHDIHQAFIPISPDGKLGKTQNVDDALSFLKAAGLIVESRASESTTYRAAGNANTTFRVQTLQAMRQLETGHRRPAHPTDALYTLLLTELFVKPNRLFIKDLHSQANQLRQVKEAGGLSKEKTRTWKRVMEYLGIGRRVAGGFLCAYTPSLVIEVINIWTRNQDTLQSFFETHFGHILPFESANGDLATSVAPAFEHLAEQGTIAVFPLQDSPTKSYFGERRWKGIERKTNEYV
jgi:hypothetical protein